MATGLVTAAGGATSTVTDILQVGFASVDGFGVLPVTTLAALAVDASMGITGKVAALAASVTVQSIGLLALAAAAVAAASAFFLRFNRFFSSFLASSSASHACARLFRFLSMQG